MVNYNLLIRLGDTYHDLDVTEGDLCTFNLTDPQLSYQFNLQNSLRLILIHN